MTYTNVIDFRKNLSDFLDDVEEKGEKVIIKRNGKPVAMLVEYKEKPDYNKFFGFMEGGETGEAYVNRVRRSKTELEWTKRYAKDIG